jgi:hypothetical protein
LTRKARLSIQPGSAAQRLLIAPIEGKMSNVVPLFKQETIDNPSDDPNKSVKIAIADILASCIRLSHTVKDLSKHFGAVDHVIDGLGDAESKSRLDQLMKQTSKALAAAMHELSQAIRKLPRLQIDAMADVAKGK